MAVQLRTQRQSERFHRMKLLRSDGKSRGQYIHINVTALVDMMTVLVIFLVMQFNASGEMLFVSKDLSMPNADHGEAVTRVPILSLSSRGSLYFEGAIIVDQLQRETKPANWMIQELETQLIENRKRFEALGVERLNKMAAAEDPTSTVNIQVDRGVDYGLLKRVLHTCEHAGYGRIRLAVGDSGKKES